MDNNIGYTLWYQENISQKQAEGISSMVCFYRVLYVHHSEDSEDSEGEISFKACMITYKFLRKLGCGRISFRSSIQA